MSWSGKMTEQNWNQNIETSVMLLGASYALSIISLVIWIADKTGF
jgi:hypothetical protein